MIPREELFQTICRSADQMQTEMVRRRRDLHHYAETAWTEMRTASLIARALDDLGYEVLTGDDAMDRASRMDVPTDAELYRHYLRAKEEGGDPEYLERVKDGMTAVVGVLHCGPGPVIGMRFDIDALAITESDSQDHLPFKEGFASCHPGAMHACGHDGHVTIGLGVAKLLMQLRSELRGTIRLIFQPAEEGVPGGARGIVRKGLLDDAGYFISAHLTTRKDHEPGRLYPGMHGALANVKWKVTMHGKSAHAGAYPQLGDNALLSACCAVMNLYAIARSSDGATRINVGKFHDYTPVNAISDEVVFEYEVRGDTTELARYMDEKAQQIVQSAALMHGCTCTLEQIGEAESFVSSQAMMDRVRRVCTQDLHMEVTASDSMHGLGSEDVSYMVNRVQELGGEATFVRLLGDQKGVAHGRTYDFDEEVLADAVKMFAGVVCDICLEEGGRA